MLTLYHHPRTRSSRFIFLLEELGAPYQIHPIANIRRPDGSGGQLCMRQALDRAVDR